MSVEVVLFLFVAGGVFTSYAVVTSRLDRKRRAAAWRSVADRRGASFGRADDTLSCRIGEAKIELSVGKDITHLVGVYPIAAGPVFALYSRSGKLGPSLDELFYPKIRADLRRLDEEFILRSREPETSRSLWSSRSATNLAEHFPDAKVVGERASVCIDIPGILLDTDLIEAAIDLTGELANADLFGIPELRALPTAADASGPGDQVCVGIEVGGTLVRYRPVFLDGRVVTRAWVDVDQGGAFEARLPDPDVPALATSLPRKLATDVIGQMARMGTGTLSGLEKRVQFTWTGVERQSNRLVAAAHVLAAFGRRPTEALYR